MLWTHSSQCGVPVTSLKVRLRVSVCFQVIAVLSGFSLRDGLFSTALVEKIGVNSL